MPFQNRPMTMEFPNPHSSTFISSLDLAELNTMYGTHDRSAGRDSIYRPGGNRDSFVDWRNPFNTEAGATTYHNAVGDEPLHNLPSRSSFSRQSGGGPSRQLMGGSAISSAKRMSNARNSVYQGRLTHRRRGSSIASDTLMEEDEETPSVCPVRLTPRRRGSSIASDSVLLEEETVIPPVPRLPPIDLNSVIAENVGEETDTFSEMASVPKFSRRNMRVSAYLDTPDYVITKTVASSRKSVSWAVQAPHPSIARKSMIAPLPNQEQEKTTEARSRQSLRLSKANSQIFDSFIALWEGVDEFNEDDFEEEEEEESDDEDGIVIPSMGYSHPDELFSSFGGGTTPTVEMPSFAFEAATKLPESATPTPSRTNTLTKSLLPALVLEFSFKRSGTPSPDKSTKTPSPVIHSPLPKRKPAPLQFSLTNSRPTSASESGSVYDWGDFGRSGQTILSTPGMVSSTSTGSTTSTIRTTSINGSPTSIEKRGKSQSHLVNVGPTKSADLKVRSTISQRFSKIFQRLWSPKSPTSESIPVSI